MNSTEKGGKREGREGKCDIGCGGEKEREGQVTGLLTSSETAMKSLSAFKSSMSCVPRCFAEATPTGSGGPGGGGGAGDGSAIQQTGRAEHN